MGLKKNLEHPKIVVFAAFIEVQIYSSSKSTDLQFLTLFILLKCSIASLINVDFVLNQSGFKGPDTLHLIINQQLGFGEQLDWQYITPHHQRCWVPLTDDYVVLPDIELRLAHAKYTLYPLSYPPPLFIIC